MDHIKLLVVLMLAVAFSCVNRGETDQEIPPNQTDTDTDTDTDTGESVTRSAGFINLQPRDIGYTYRYDEYIPETDEYIEVAERINGTTHEANIFYAFVPADTNPKDMPLMVLLNGGPSAATSCHLFAYGTSPYFVDRDDPAQLIKANPASFSAIANLLYIDTRQAGFSYELAVSPEAAVMRDPSEAPPPDVINFNVYTDVSDILLTVLGVMANEPSLADNPIVLTGESYGGARLGLIIALLSDPAALLNPAATYYDPSLGEALERHFANLMPERSFESLSLSDVVEQFGWQVLLQPGDMLPNRPDFTWARCRDMPESDPRYAMCSSPNVNEFDLRLPWTELDNMGITAANLFLHPPVFETFFGVTPETVAWLSAADRVRAFRDVPLYQTGTPSAEWLERLGQPGAKDYYYTPLTPIGNAGCDESFTAMAFMKSLGYVNTFITNAYFDKVIASDKIPAALVNANAYLQTPLVASAVLDMASPGDEERPGEMTVVFTEAMGLGPNASVTVRMPTYYDSGHMVPLREALALREDIRSFLEERGAYR